jgi:hypothetical protein
MFPQPEGVNKWVPVSRVATHDLSHQELAAVEKPENEFLEQERRERAKQLGLVFPNPDTRYHFRPPNLGPVLSRRRPAPRARLPEAS